jgi:hypothetical protein
MSNRYRASPTLTSTPAEARRGCQLLQGIEREPGFASSLEVISPHLKLLCFGLNGSGQSTLLADRQGPPIVDLPSQDFRLFHAKRKL